MYIDVPMSIYFACLCISLSIHNVLLILLLLLLIVNILCSLVFFYITEVAPILATY